MRLHETHAVFVIVPVLIIPQRHVFRLSVRVRIGLIACVAEPRAVGEVPSAVMRSECRVAGCACRIGRVAVVHLVVEDGTVALAVCDSHAASGALRVGQVQHKRLIRLNLCVARYGHGDCFAGVAWRERHGVVAQRRVVGAGRGRAVCGVRSHGDRGVDCGGERDGELERCALGLGVVADADRGRVVVLYRAVSLAVCDGHAASGALHVGQVHHERLVKLQDSVAGGCDGDCFAGVAWCERDRVAAQCRVVGARGRRAVCGVRSHGDRGVDCGGERDGELERRALGLGIVVDADCGRVVVLDGTVALTVRDGHAASGALGVGQVHYERLVKLQHGVGCGRDGDCLAGVSRREGDGVTAQCGVVRTRRGTAVRGVRRDRDRGVDRGGERDGELECRALGFGGVGDADGGCVIVLYRAVALGVRDGDAASGALDVRQVHNQRLVSLQHGVGCGRDGNRLAGVSRRERDGVTAQCGVVRTRRGTAVRGVRSNCDRGVDRCGERDSELQGRTLRFCVVGDADRGWIVVGDLDVLGRGCSEDEARGWVRDGKYGSFCGFEHGIVLDGEGDGALGSAVGDGDLRSAQAVVGCRDIGAGDSDVHGLCAGHLAIGSRGSRNDCLRGFRGGAG